MNTRTQSWLAQKWMTSYRLNALRTRWRATVHPCRCTTPLLIFGCQRSGTTMLSHLIGLSPDVRTYGDGDPEYFERRGAPRLLDLDRVSAQLARERNRFTLLKPLCESQRAAELLEAFPRAKAIWIFRHYEPCVRSHVSYYSQFHDGVSYVREMLNWDAPCWKNENLPEETRSFLREQSPEALSPENAYALYWLARNSLFFTDELPQSRILLVNYEQAIADPNSAAEAIFHFAGVRYKPAYASLISPPSGSPRRELPIAPQVAETCQRLYDDLLKRATI
jgi:hypothetical protein